MWKYPNSIPSPRRCGITKVNVGLFQRMRDMTLWYQPSSIKNSNLCIHWQLQISKPLFNIMLSTLNILIQTQKLPSWDILTKNPSLWGEIISSNILNMVQVTRDILPMTGWSYKFITALTSLRLFIPVFISYFYLIIPVGMIEEQKTGWM